MSQKRGGGELVLLKSARLEVALSVPVYSVPVAETASAC